jgi:ribosome assembly protein 4
VVLCKAVMVLSGHTQSVTGIKWGGEGLIYTASQDRTIKVWRTKDGCLCRSLQGHGHWVNTMALSTDYSLRTAAFDPGDPTLQHTGVQKMGRKSTANSRAKN